MKEIIRYRCEYCGMEHTKKEECEECEKSHIPPDKILNSDFNNDHCGYPEAITVKFKNGKKGRYKRIGYENGNGGWIGL